jgi:hypothetical protein
MWCSFSSSALHQVGWELRPGYQVCLDQRGIGIAAVIIQGIRLAETRRYVAALLLSIVAFLRSPSYFSHHGAFVALPLAMIIGATVATLRQPVVRWRGVPSVVSVVSILLVILVGGAREFIRQGSQSSIRSATDSLKLGSLCAFTD